VKTTAGAQRWLLVALGKGSENRAADGKRSPRRVAIAPMVGLKHAKHAVTDELQDMAAAGLDRGGDIRRPKNSSSASITTRDPTDS
jgi:hypothetical protein